MKIGIISDLHMGHGKSPRLSESKYRAIKKILGEVGCLVMCGDNAELSSNLENHKRLLKTIRSMSNIPAAFISGNHDLIGRDLLRGITIDKIKSRLNQYSILAREYGMVHLEEQNMVIDDLVVCGTYGHYDGTLSGIKFEEDHKTVLKLVKDLEYRADTPGRKMLITHSVPTKAMIGRLDGPVQDKFTPFAGSIELKEAICRIKPDWHFCGHTRAYACKKIGRTKSFNVGADYADLFYFVVDTSDSSAVRLEKKLHYPV